MSARHRFGSATGRETKAEGEIGREERTIAEVLDDRLAHDLRLAIRAVGLQACRLWDRDYGRGAVDGRTRGVDYPRAVKLGHDLE